MNERKTGLAAPSNLLSPTQPRSAAEDVRTPTRTPRIEADGPAEPLRKKSTLYLSPEVRQRLRLAASESGVKLSDIAEDVLRQHLPEYTLRRKAG